MNEIYRELTHNLIPDGTTVRPGPDQQDPTLSLNDSAERIITDFTDTKPFSIAASATLAQVSAKMVTCGVRMLFVTDEDDRLNGLITLTDLDGEKPIIHIQENGGSRDDIRAQDIMTPFEQIEALEHAEAARARIGDIVKTIQAAGRQHMLVRQDTDMGASVITGIISASRLEKKLGIVIEFSQQARSFDELTRALA